MATYLLFDEGHLGGLIGCSGAHIADIDWNKIDIRAKKQTPVRLYHGIEDKILPIDEIK